MTEEKAGERLLTNEHMHIILLYVHMLIVF